MQRLAVCIVYNKFYISTSFNQDLLHLSMVIYLQSRTRHTCCRSTFDLSHDRRRYSYPWTNMTYLYLASPTHQKFIGHPYVCPTAQLSLLLAQSWDHNLSRHYNKCPCPLSTIICSKTLIAAAANRMNDGLAKKKHHLSWGIMILSKINDGALGWLCMLHGLKEDWV